VYLGVHWGLRVGLSGALATDDARDLFFTQSLEWGYLPKQPPLFNWAAWAGVQALGASVLALAVVKYLFLGAVLGLIYLAGRRVVQDPRLAGLAAFSLLLMVPINWVVHELLTHTVAALAAAAGTFYALLRLEDARGPGPYLALGTVLGLGVLAKFSYLFVAAALLLAALTVPAFRARLADRRIVLTLLVAVALVAPYLVWFSTRRLSLAAMYAEEVRPVMAVSYPGGVASGALYLARVTLYFLVPFGIVVALLAPGAFTRRGSLAGSSPAARLLERFLLVEGVLLVGGILLGQITYLKFRWMAPVYILVPLYALARLERLPGVEAALRRLTAVIVAAEAIIVVAFAASIFRGDLGGPPSQLAAPYDRVAAELRAAGFHQGTIVTGGGSLAGNLRLSFPGARILRLTNPDYQPQARRAGAAGPPGQCLVAWEPDLRNPPRADLRAWTVETLGVEASRLGPARTIDVPYHHARKTRFRVDYVLLPDGSGSCR
jgi:4-amino-4-deoxy-L-arabinose transferase-like glycosyltransferase